MKTKIGIRCYTHIMVKVKISKVYHKKEAPKNLDFDFDKKHTDKPHWIYVKNFKKKPRFLSISTPKNSELIYKAFGNFFYPIDHLPSQRVQKSLMRAAASNYDKIVGDLNDKIAKFLLEKVKNLNLPKDIRIVDLGAGTGKTSIPFIKSGYQGLTLVDISEEMKRVAQAKRTLKSTDYRIQDIRKLKLDKKYDLVISGMFLCDLNDRDLKKAFESLIPYLTKGAYIALVEDENRSVYSKYFEPIESGMFPVGDYKKYFLIGRLKQKH